MNPSKLEKRSLEDVLVKWWFRNFLYIFEILCQSSFLNNVTGINLGMTYATEYLELPRGILQFSEWERIFFNILQFSQCSPKKTRFSKWWGVSSQF